MCIRDRIDGCYFRDFVLMQQYCHPFVPLTVKLTYCSKTDFYNICACASDGRAPSAWNPDIHCSRRLMASKYLDFNPVDYRIWGVMQDRVYQTAVWDVANLKQRLTNTWNRLSQSIVDDAVDEWQKRLKEKEDILNICCNNWTWADLVVQLNLCFRLYNNRPNVLSLHVSLCTWLISQGSVAKVRRWGAWVNK